jgi:hypothetical protein
VTRCGDVMMSARGEPALERGKGGDDVNCADTNFTGPKNDKNSNGRFSCFKWTVKI